MANRLEYSTGRVFAFVNTITPLPLVAGMTAIGLESDGELVAGVMYEGINEHNAWMHVAAKPEARCTRGYLAACFAYPFVQCGVKRVRGYVNASNQYARRFDEHLGFKPEAVLQGAAADGGDVIIYVMLREDCRYV